MGWEVNSKVSWTPEKPYQSRTILNSDTINCFYIIELRTPFQSSLCVCLLRVLFFTLNVNWDPFLRVVVSEYSHLTLM